MKKKEPNVKNQKLENNRITFLFFNQSRVYSPILESFWENNKDNKNIIGSRKLLENKRFQYSVSLMKSILPNAKDEILYGISSYIWAENNEVKPFKEFMTYTESQVKLALNTVSFPSKMFGDVPRDVLYFSGNIEFEDEIVSIIDKWRVQIEKDKFSA